MGDLNRTRAFKKFRATKEQLRDMASICHLRMAVQRPCKKCIYFGKCDQTKPKEDVTLKQEEPYETNELSSLDDGHDRSDVLEQ